MGYLGNLIIDKNSPEKYTAEMSTCACCGGAVCVSGLLLGGV